MMGYNCYRYKTYLIKENTNLSYSNDAHSDKAFIVSNLSYHCPKSQENLVSGLSNSRSSVKYI